MDSMDLASSTNALRISSSSVVEFPSIFDDSAMSVDPNYEWQAPMEDEVSPTDMLNFSTAPQPTEVADVPHGQSSFGVPDSVRTAPIPAPIMNTQSPLLHSLPRVEIRAANDGGPELRRSKRSAAIAATNILIPAAHASLRAQEESKVARKYNRRGLSNKGNVKQETAYEEEQQEGVKVSKNREAAQLFRQRQRDHIRSLEDQVEKLAIQNQIYLSQHDQLTAEGKLIRQQLLLLREFVSQAMSFAFSNISTNVLYQQLQHLMAQQKLTEAAAASQQPQQPSNMHVSPMAV